MNLKDFQKRIQETPLFNEEQKGYFLSRAESYSPEQRVEMIGILEEHEKRAVDRIKAYRQEKKAKQSEALFKSMQEHGIYHKQEVQLAEDELDKDLKNIS